MAIAVLALSLNVASCPANVRIREGRDADCSRYDSGSLDRRTRHRGNRLQRRRLGGGPIGRLLRLHAVGIEGKLGSAFPLELLHGVKDLPSEVLPSECPKREFHPIT